METPIVILAGGNSARFGKPKLLLDYQGISLLEHTITCALNAACGKVIVVLGAYASLMIPLIPKQADYVINTCWADGISSNIMKGIQTALLKCPLMNNIILSAADQPFISTTVFLSLINQHRRRKIGAVFSDYGHTTGIPALFGKEHFDLLLGLQGEAGVKPLFATPHKLADKVYFEKGGIDIDTQIDYYNLITASC